jgi:hypothetical protein
MFRYSLSLSLSQHEQTYLLSIPFTHLHISLSVFQITNVKNSKRQNAQGKNVEMIRGKGLPHSPINQNTFQLCLSSSLSLSLSMEKEMMMLSFVPDT